MNAHRLVIALAALNLGLLVFTVSAQSTAPVMRVSALELVDERGVVRSRISVEPEGEVVLRLMDRAGTIRVKLGASERGSGLLLLDESTEPAIHMTARRGATQVTLKESGGKERAIRP